MQILTLVAFVVSCGMQIATDCYTRATRLICRVGDFPMAKTKRAPIKIKPYLESQVIVPGMKHLIILPGMPL